MKSRMRKRWKSTPWWLLALSLALAGCSFLSGAKDTPPKVPATSTPEPTVTPEMMVTEIAGAKIEVPRETNGQQAPQELVTPFPPRLEVVDEVILNCGTEDDPALWGIWKVKNNDPGNWIRQGKAEVVAEGPGGTVLYRTSFSFSYGADAVGWMSPGQLLYGKGSKIEKIRLELLETDWNPLDATANQYDIEVKLIHHSIDEEGKHRLKVEVHNKSDLLMDKVQLSAVVFDSNGEIVDVLSSRDSVPVVYRKIPFGEKQFIVAQSLFPKQCRTKLDSSDYSADYWIHFDTIIGQKVTQFFHADRVSDIEPIVVKATGSEVTRDGIRVKFTVSNRDEAPHIVKVEAFALADWVCPPPDQGDTSGKTYKDARHYGLGFVDVQGGETVEASIIADDRDLDVYGIPSYIDKRFYNECDIDKLGTTQMRWDLLYEKEETIIRSVHLVDFFTGPYEIDPLSKFEWSFTIENSDDSAHQVGVECRYVNDKYPFFPHYTSTGIYSVEVPGGGTASSTLRLVNADWYEKFTGQVEDCEIIKVGGSKYREARP